MRVENAPGSRLLTLARAECRWFVEISTSTTSTLVAGFEPCVSLVAP